MDWVSLNLSAAIDMNLFQYNMLQSTKRFLYEGNAIKITVNQATELDIGQITVTGH